MLVVGGTGILREVVDGLAREADVTAVVRRPGRLPDGVRRLRADTGAPATAVPAGFDAAVVYAPAVHAGVLLRIVRATRGPVVLVVPSAALGEDGGHDVRALVARAGAVPVLLGWTGPAAAPRWHSPAEIAPAVCTALAERRPVRLGRLTGRRPD